MQIAQSEEDEADMLEWLGQQGDFLCAPAVFEGEFRPVPLGDTRELRQVVFLARHQAILAGLVRPLLERAGHQIDPHAAGDYLLAWSRTHRSGNRITVGGECVSRVFYGPTGRDDDVVRSMTKLMSRLIAYLKRSSVMKSTAPRPIFVGKHLAAEVAAGRKVIVYPSGAHVPLISC